jgi:hypothetical protein
MFPRSGRKYFLQMALYSALPVSKAVYFLLLAILGLTQKVRNAVYARHRH